jgi:hypothetical protein
MTAPPRDGWIEIDKRTAGFLKAARLDGVAVETPVGQEKSWAPPWAHVIASVDGVSDRMKIGALKKAARDPDVQPVVSTLLACLDPEDRRGLVEQLGQAFGQALVCTCGMKFVDASLWREHVELFCPRRKP